MKTLSLQGRSAVTALKASSHVSARRRLFAGVAAVGFASALSAPLLKLSSRRKHRLADKIGRLKAKRKFLPPFLVDGFIGAIGEIGQLAVLYPLDTIKVRCQAQGASTRVIWEGVRSQGFNAANLASLFAGCAPSALCAGLIGACYLASFCGAKRVLARADGGRGSSLKPAQYDAAMAMSEPSASLALSGDRQAEAERSHQRDKGHEASSTGRQPMELSTSAANDTAAALIASLLTSVLEAPVELFRHRMQAGLSKGRMLSNMATAFGGGGLGSLYWGYAPFLLKAIPYDVAELFSHSQLTKHQHSIPLISSLPTTFRDCFTGAAAGAAAVLFSMPADCIKTRMELGATRPPPGLLRGSAAFVRTGRVMLAERGLRSMFVGVAPRLLENVPSTMFYWVLVAALRRSLQPFTNDGNDA